MNIISMKKESEGNEDCCYGMTIDLDEEQVAALGINKLPNVGDKLSIQGTVTVKRTVVENDGEGKERYLTLEITDLGVGKSRSNDSDIAKRMYQSGGDE